MSALTHPPRTTHPQTAGNVTPLKGLPFVTVHDAGHHVPFSKPAQAKQMIEVLVQDVEFATSVGSTYDEIEQAIKESL